MKRREFIKASAIGAVAHYIVPRSVLASPGRPGANDRIAVGIIGCGGRMGAVACEAPSDLQIVSLADCDLRQMSAESTFGAAMRNDRRLSDDFPRWNRYQDYRRMFEKERLDAVFVTTTTHARVLICIHAVQAGLDVYAEKPLTLTIQEGQALVKAVRKHQRVLQVGTQARSIPLNCWTNDLIRNGKLGKIKTVLAHNFESPLHHHPKPAVPVPQELNWDMWCNQTPLVPYCSEDFHPSCGRWGQWWDYDGGGMSWGMTGWGTHGLDMIQSALGTDYTGPVEVWPVEPGKTDSPITMRYASGVLLEMKLPRGYGPLWGAIFIGEKGKIETNRDKCVSNPPELVAGHPKPIDYPTSPHLQNWIGCMRSRKRPNADVEIAHRSTTLCHLANIARQLGRRLQWNPEKEIFIGDEEANRLCSRPRRKGYELPENL